MSKIIFFCHDSRSNIESFEYYKQDIDALTQLGHEVVICTKYREIPLLFDAMFIWWWTYALWPVAISWLLNKPSIITGTFNFQFPENFPGRDYFRRPLWQRALIRVATQMSTLNLFVNPGELKNCSEFFSLNSARYYPHIVSDDYLQGPSTNRKKVLFNLAWSGKENLIRKGIPELLEAIRILRQEGCSVTLHLAGPEGDGKDYLVDTINALDIGEEVHLLGQLTREDKLAHLRMCEIYVQPSHYEGFGLAMAEAMGCGACVITCDVGAVKSVVGDCGIYVQPGSPQELADSIKRVLHDEDLRLGLQNRAQERAIKHFTFSRKLASLQNYLSEVGIA